MTEWAMIMSETCHPYQKPQRLKMHLMEMFSNEDDWILDLFSIHCPNCLMKTNCVLGITFTCALEIFHNSFALEKDEEQVIL